MMIRISTLWFMWIGGALYDLVCAWWPFFVNHTAEQRFQEDLAVACFIVAAWILARWIQPSPQETAGS